MKLAQEIAMQIQAQPESAIAEYVADAAVVIRSLL
jgi:hypothetical protein